MTQVTQPVAAAPERPRRRRRRAWWLIPLSLATLGTLAWMGSVYIPPDMRTSRVDVHGDVVRYWLLLGHIGFGTIATATGLLQIWPGLRRRFPCVHRWVGRLYLFAGVFPATILAVPVIYSSESGASNVAGLATMMLLWAYTGVMGLRTARARRYAEHRRWMIRNYAVTLSILTSRAWGVIMVLGIGDPNASAIYHGDMELFIHDVASGGTWLALLANLIIAEYLIQRAPRTTRGRRSPRPVAARPAESVPG